MKQIMISFILKIKIWQILLDDTNKIVQNEIHLLENQTKLQKQRTMFLNNKWEEPR